MQSLDTACEEGERAIKRFKPNRSSFPLLTSQEPSCSSTQQEFVDNPGGKMPFDIFTKLLELHEETNEGIEGSGTKYTTLLLEKLVAKERLNTLIVNLHPGNKGYSLAFRVVSRSDPNYIDDTANMIETKQWPYEVDELLRYIDNEELPPFIIDLLEPQFSYLFYNGCIIAEVRDYRQAYPEYKCDIHHVLLRPTQKSILADINNIVEEKSDWSNEEKDQLESQLLMANEPSLCLEPDITTYQHLTELSNRKRTWNTHEFRRMAKKFSQVTVNRKRKLDQFTHKPGLEILDFVSRTRTKPKIGTTQNLTSKPVKKIPEDIKPVPIPNLECPQIAPPSTEIVINEFKTYTRPQATSDCLPQLIEEYVLETDMPSKDKDKPRVYHIKLSILQRPSNSEYLGELYLDRDHKKNEQNGVACRFSLGSRANATRYIHQFTEIFTESGRKSVRIRYGLSPGYKERVASAQAQAQQQVHMQITNQQNTQQIQSQMIQNQTYTAPIVNGSIAGTIGVQMQMQNPVSSVPTLQSHLQSSNATKSTSQVLSNQEQAINALATKLMNSAQQFQAAANAKQQQQQQQKLSGNNAAIINLLNSSPASNLNSDASAAVVNAINNTPLLSQQLQTINQKILARKMTIPNSRVLNHGNLITLNNNRLQELQQQQQQQTITLSSVNNANFTNFTTVPVKQQRIVSNNSNDNKSALSALLMGTPAADRPDIVGPNTNSLLLEKLGGASSTTQQTAHFIQSPKPNQQFMVQSPKSTTVLSPMSSPPPQNSNTINVQSLNFAQLQSISGLQNLQVQLGFAQPISLSLNVSSTGNIQGHPASLIVSLPVTTANQSSTTVTQAQGGTNNLTVGGQTVVLQANAGASNIAQLVTSGVKATQQTLRTTTSPQAVSLTQTGQPFQLLAPLQRPRGAQQASSPQQQTRSLQRSTPITIKMAAPNTANASQVNLPHLQQFQQICLNQPDMLGKIRRRSSNSELQ